MHPRLTTMSKGSGCGCKIAPATLDKILSESGTAGNFPDLMVGYTSRDDAAIYLLNDQEAIISTTDFFTPMVDDPVAFGRIAAANSISDVYAMGGTPVMALSILGWPVNTLPEEMAAEVIKGAREVCHQAGIPIAGGHSIDIPEPVFGLAVTGKIHPEHIKRNDTAQVGDLIYLTKPLGTGIISAALKRDQASSEDVQSAIKVMETLNNSGSLWARYEWIHAMTDVTGFGLLGHLKECCSNGLGAELYMADIPVLDAARKYAKAFIFPDNTWRNWQAYNDFVLMDDESQMPLLADPQTNGGLLISVDPAFQMDFEQKYSALYPGQTILPIGRFSADNKIRVLTR
jgi:selenide,water dikinase